MNVLLAEGDLVDIGEQFCNLIFPILPQVFLAQVDIGGVVGVKVELGVVNQNEELVDQVLNQLHFGGELQVALGLDLLIPWVKLKC